MSTQQDIYAAGSESRPPMLNKENYVPWSSRLLRYAKSRPNGKLIHNSILNGPYVRRMIAEPGDGERDVNVNETFHEQTDDELSERELKQIEADDQAIQTILLGLPEDIYAAVDSCETAQEIWLRVQQMMKGSDIGIQEKKAKLFNEWERFTSNEGESIESYYHRFLKLMNDLKRNKHFPEKIASNLKFLNNLQPEWSRYVTIVHQTKDLHTADYTQFTQANSNNPFASLALHQDQSPLNQNFLQQPITNPEDITDPTTAMNMALALMAKAFKLNYTTPTNNNQRISSNPRNRQIAQPGNLNGYNEVQNVRNQVAQNPRVQNVGTQNGLIGVQGNGIQNQIGNEWSRHVTIVHQTKDLHTVDYTQLYDFLKYNQKEVDELKAERLAKTQDPLALMANSNNPYASPAPHQQLSSFNQNYMQPPMKNPKDITDPTTAMNMALALMAKAFKLNYSTPTNNNQRISSNLRNRQIAQPGQNAGILNGYNAVQNVGNQVIQNAVQNPRPEWSRHVTIVHQAKDLHTADYTQLYDFLKY
nr:hypothetical protein [Tanacetum cinerariifolium]